MTALENLEPPLITCEAVIAEATWSRVLRGFDAEPLGERQVKGIDRPVSLWSVRGPRLSVVEGRPFFGRQIELRQLIGVLDAAGIYVALLTALELKLLVRGHSDIGAAWGLTQDYAPLAVLVTILLFARSGLYGERAVRGRDQSDAALDRLLEGLDRDVDQMLEKRRWMLAQQRGYFAQEGLKVNFVTAKGGVDAAVQVGAGNAPVGGAIGDTPIVRDPTPLAHQ